MRNRLWFAVTGIVVVIIVLAGLSGVLNLLKNTSPSFVNSQPRSSITNSQMPKPEGINLSPTISTEGTLPPHVPLFDISGASNTPLLRNAVSSILDNNTWKIDPNVRSVPYNGGKIESPVKGFSQQSVDDVKVNPLQNYSSGPVEVPTSLYPTSISFPKPLTYLPDDQTFISEQGLPEAYSFQATHYKFDESTLNEAQIDPQSKYLQLPPEVTERTKILANDITENKQSPYQKAKAIENYLKSKYTYDLSYQHAPKGQEPNDWFLFDEKKGVCENFNSAFVTLARSAGIPSRLVGGFAISPNPGKQTIYADQAHAWSEVNFKDLGWITFDATGSGAGPIATVTEIITVSPLVQKGHSFNVGGTVKSIKGEAVDGLPMEIFVNSKKDTTGGVLIGKGSVSQGTFNIQVTVPEDAKVGDYQLLAHCLGGIRYQHSWSDPKIKVFTVTNINLDSPKLVKIYELVEIKGALTEEYKQPVSGQKMDLFLNDKQVSSLSTDQIGHFHWEQSFNQPGNYTVKALFPGNDYYVKSSQTTNIQALIPTAMSFNSPQHAIANETVIMEGSLLEERTGKPVFDQPITIFIDGKPIQNIITTKPDGSFMTEYFFDKDGVYQIDARFNAASIYWESHSNSAIEILPGPGSFPWAYLAPAMILIIVGTAGYLLYIQQKRNKLAIKSLRPLYSPNPVVMPEISEMNTNGIYLKIEFPQIEPMLPDVWGVDEELLVISNLISSNGEPLANKTIRLLIGDKEIKIRTDSNGTGRFQFAFRSKGTHILVANYLESQNNIDISAKRNIRIVDYREEIVELFNSFLVWIKGLGLDVKPKATPREIQELVSVYKKEISKEGLENIVSSFEEAEYSLHDIIRNTYKTMYLSLELVKKHDCKTKID